MIIHVIYLELYYIFHILDLNIYMYIIGEAIAYDNKMMATELLNSYLLLYVLICTSEFY